jgi:hypothetical protein
MFALPWGQNCYLEDYKFHNFGRGLLALHHHAFSFSSTYAVVKKIFENWSILGSFCPAPKAPGGQGSWNSQFLFPFTHRCYKPNLVESGSAVPEKKLKMFKSLRTTDDGRERIAIGHLSDSGDLKKKKWKKGTTHRNCIFVYDYTVYICLWLSWYMYIYTHFCTSDLFLALH